MIKEMKDKYIQVDYYKLGNKYGFSDSGTSPDELRAMKIALAIVIPIIILIGIFIF